MLFSICFFFPTCTTCLSMFLFRCVNFENPPRLSQILVKHTMTQKHPKSTRHIHLPGCTQFTQCFVWGGWQVCLSCGKASWSGELRGYFQGGPLIYTERAQTMADLSSTGELSHCVATQTRSVQNLIGLYRS